MTKLVIPGARRALPTPLTAAEKQDIEDNVGTATLDRIAALEGPAVNNSLTLSSIGNSLSDIEAMLNVGARNRISVDQTLNFSSRIGLTKAAYVELYASSTRATVNVTDGGSGRPGGFSSNGFANLVFTNLDFVFSGTSSLGILESSSFLRASFFSCTFAGITNEKILNSFRMGTINSYFLNTPIVPGSTFNGVASGDNPNTASGVSHISNQLTG